MVLEGRFMGKLGKINDHRTALGLFVLCWAAYFTSYIGRLNYSSAMTQMIREGILAKSQAGFISMVYFFAYGAGQLCNGILGDRMHPGRMIFTGLSVAAVMNLLMGFVETFFVMAVIWGVNGYAQAMIWPPVIRIFAEMLDKERKMKYCIDIVSSQVAGTFASYLIAAGVMWLAGWKAVFMAASACLALMAAVWHTGFRKVEQRAEKNPEKEDLSAGGQTAQKPSAETAARADAGHSGGFLAIFCGSGLAAVLFPVVIHGMLKDGVTTWVPTYITETFYTTPAFSILVTTVLPLLNLTGAYMARYVYRKCKEYEMSAAAVFFAAATAALFGLWIADGISLVLTVLLFAVITASMMAVNTLFINMLPLRFEKTGRVSSVSGFLNAAAYLGTAVSTFTIGIMVERLGWNLTIAGWLVFTAAALFVCVVYRSRSKDGE